MKERFVVPLDAVQARALVDEAFAEYGRRYSKYQPSLRSIDGTRAEASFTVKGFCMKAQLRVVAGAIEVDADVPFALRLFRTKARHVVERELSHWLKRPEHQGQ